MSLQCRSEYSAGRSVVCLAVAAIFATTATIYAAQDRLPPVPPDRLTEAQKAAAAEFKAARNVDVFGPFVPLLRSPELMNRARAMGDYLRYRSSLPPRLSEFVILLTARDWTQQYEWVTHHDVAIKAGLSPATAAAIADGRRPLLMQEDEEILYDLCTELRRTQRVSDATYARALAKFGEPGVVDAVGIVGYYTFLAMILNTARTPIPDGTPPPLVGFPR